MKVISDRKHDVEGHPNFKILGAVEDGGRIFVYLRQYNVPESNEKGDILKNPKGKPYVGIKDYIEETVVGFDFESKSPTIDLKHIDDDDYVMQLSKFFHDEIFWKELLEKNKRKIDEILAKGGEIPKPIINKKD